MALEEGRAIERAIQIEYYLENMRKLDRLDGLYVVLLILLQGLWIYVLVVEHFRPLALGLFLFNIVLFLSVPYLTSQSK